MAYLLLWTITVVIFLSPKASYQEDYNLVNPDGSFDFGYDTPDSYHRSQGNRNNIVRGDFGSRSPETGGIDTVQYTAGPRGFRPRGKNIARKYDFNQIGPRPVGSVDDQYFDPSEDPSYNFAFNTGVYNKQEAANRVGDVTGRYTYLDDIGERHQVDYIAGKNTGFHVKTPFPDSNPRAMGPLFFNGRGRPIPRGRTSIQRSLDGSYKFVSAGPDQRRTEISDSTGHVRGSYTYLDDKGVQHAVHYIAGPEIGYRVLKNVNGPHLPTIFPFAKPDILPSDFYDYFAPDNIDLFDTAASGHVKPTPASAKPLQPNTNRKDQTIYNGVDLNNFDDSTDANIFGSDGSSGTGGSTFPTQSSGSATRPSGNRRPTPSYDDDGLDVFNEDIFGPPASKPSSATTNPVKPQKPPSTDDGSYKPTGDNGSYNPSKNFGEETLGNNDGTLIFNDGGFGNRKESGIGNPPSRSETGSKIPNSNGGTIVRNIGDRYLSIAPGSMVRAHVQAIDLLDVHGRVISPSDQLKAESAEQNLEGSSIKEEFNTVPTTTTHKEVTTTKNGTQAEPLPL